MKDLRWNERRAEYRVKPLLEKLGPIPRANHLSPVYGAVKVSDYFDLVAGRSELEQKMCGYFLCLSIILSVLLNDLPQYARAKIVCEEQKEYEPLAGALFKSFSEVVAETPGRAYFSGIEFIPKDSSSLTQPSDYLAFAITKYYDERGSRKDLWCRPIFGGKEPERVAGRCSTKQKSRETVQAILKLAGRL